MSKRQDLTGMVFGRLTVINKNEEESNKLRNGRRNSYWNCRCECGNLITLRGNSLTSGNTVSCGCYKKETDEERVRDLTGQVFGRLTVIKENGRDKNGKVMWLCQCECGKEKTICGESLKNGNTQSCGCSSSKDLTGMKFGKLTVISLNEEESNKLRKRGNRKVKLRFWNCQCECGNTKVVSSNSLLEGHVTSCGCGRIKDLTGMKFGKLTVISKNENRKSRAMYWNCKCECGNTRVIKGTSLTSGKTKSCGCYVKETIKKLWEDEGYKQRQSDMAKARHGDKHPNWQGGITPITNHLRNMQIVQDWHKNSKEQVNYICQLTGKTGTKLNTHHLLAFSMIIRKGHELHNIPIKEQVNDYTREELKLLEDYVAEWHKDTSNAVVLCDEVHKLFHNLYGKGDNTREQYEEFKQRYLDGEFDNI